MKRGRTFWQIAGLTLGLLLAFSSTGLAHCDTMNGPVVKAGKQALETGDIRYALVWVKEKGEAEIKHAFERAMAVRKTGDEARALADRYFFETLVRVHRAGEGAPYTGLKEEEQPEKGIAAAEEALQKGSAKELASNVAKEVQEGIETSFHRVMETKPKNPTDVSGGRRHVEAYVTYIHYIEGLHKALTPPSGSEHQAAEVEHAH